MFFVAWCRVSLRRPSNTIRSTVVRRLAPSRRSALKRLNRYLRSLEEDKIDLIDDRVWWVEASIHQLWRGTRSSRRGGRSSTVAAPHAGERPVGGRHLSGSAGSWAASSWPHVP